MLPGPRLRSRSEPHRPRRRDCGSGSCAPRRAPGVVPHGAARPSGVPTDRGGRRGGWFQIAVDVVEACPEAAEEGWVQGGEPHGGAVYRFLHGPAHRTRALQDPTGSAEQGFRWIGHHAVDVATEHFGEGRRGSGVILEPVHPQRVGDSLDVPVHLQSLTVAFPQYIGRKGPLRAPVREPDLAGDPVFVEQVQQPEGQSHLVGCIQVFGEHVARPGMRHLVGREQHVRLLVAHPSAEHLANTLISQPTPCRLHGLHLHSGSMASLPRPERNSPASLRRCSPRRLRAVQTRSCQHMFRNRERRTEKRFDGSTGS